MIKKYINKFRQKLSDVVYQRLLMILKSAPPVSKTLFINDLAFTTTTKFHPEVKCYTASPIEYKRSQQVMVSAIVEWLDSFAPGEVFYDIGANIGMFGLYLCKQHAKKIKCIAFEPSFSTFNTLMRNVALNDASDVLWCYQIALSEFTHLGTFHYSDLSAGVSQHALDIPKTQNRMDFVPALQQSMLTYSLDDFVEEFKLPIPNHIKIDVDGGEFEILRGSQDMLQCNTLQSILVEIVDLHENDERTAEIVGFMKKYNFDVVNMIIHNKEPGYPRTSDYLFRKETRP